MRKKKSINIKKPKKQKSIIATIPYYDIGGWHNLSGSAILDSLSAAGIIITNEIALKIAAVYACVKVISETIASLPLFVYRRLLTGGKEIATDHYLYHLLHTQPNSWQTSFQWREMICNWLCLNGNAYNNILRNSNGIPVELYPLRADRVKAEWVNDRLVRYVVKAPDGRKIYIPQENMLHIANTTLDGLNGLSPIALASETIGAAIAIRKFGVKTFTSGGNKRLALEHPKLLSKEAYQRLRETWEANYGGIDNQGKTAILEEGLKASVIGMSLEDAQRIEAEQFSVEDICRFYRMPPHKIQHLLRATYSNIEEQSIEFGTDTILPWCRRIESAINRDLVYEDDIFVEFEISGLLRGNAQARAAFYTALFNIGALSINEIRNKENMNGIGEQGDKRFIPLNMRELDKTTMTNIPDEEMKGNNQTTETTIRKKELLKVFIDDAAERISKSYERERAKIIDPDKLVEFEQKQYQYVLKVLEPIWKVWGGEIDKEIILNIANEEKENKDKWIQVIEGSLK